MKISENTKISEIIKFNSDAIDAIASVNSHFKKLKNPILRKLLAHRVTLQEAAKIGKCSLEDLVAKLHTLGFEFEYSDSVLLKEKEKGENIDEAQLNIVESFDVRPVLANGIDPFQQIMSKINMLKKGEYLHLKSSFEPLPLIKILKAKNFHCHVLEKNEIFNVYIAPESDIKSDFFSSDKKNIIEHTNYVEFSKKVSTFESQNKIEQLNVHGLEMPMPMVSILEKMEVLPDDVALFVNHFQVPRFLFDEIEKRKLFLEYCETKEGEVHLIIYR